MLALYWKRRVLGPEEIVCARKARGSDMKVCEVSAFYFSGYVAITIRRTARHWYGLDINDVTCPTCRERLELKPRC